MKKTLLLLSLFSLLMLRTFAGGCAFTSQADTINPLLITFTYIGWPGPQTYSWDFGDSAGTSTLQNPTYTYAAPGLYNVVLNSMDTNGIPCTYNLQVIAGGTSNCNFLYSTSGPAPVTITFTDASVGSNVTWQWDFGDGSPVTTLQNPSHTYTTPGTYNACLTTSDINGVPCVTCQSIVVSTNCNASFQFATSGMTTYFYDNSTNVNLGTLTYFWDFNDGTSSTLRYPMHVFAQPGMYMVSLTISDGVSCNSMVFDSVNVDTIPPAGCNSSFIFTELQPYSIDIVNTSYGLTPSYLWDFGDGSTSNLANPMHSYAFTGSYIICLSITDTTGCTSNFCDSLNVDSLGNITDGISSGFSITVISPADLATAVEKIENSGISVYPNPSREFFNVNIGKAKSEYKYTLRSFTGSVCKSGHLNSGKNIIETHQLASGIYLMEMKNDQGETEIWKIIKE
jgi:PKD repeat protein